MLAPVNFRLAPREISFIINGAGAKLMVVDTRFGGVAAGTERDLTTVETVHATAGSGDNPGDPAWPGYDACRHAGADEDVTVEIDPQDDLIQMYTSGATGLPKGAQLIHANIAALLDLEEIAWDDRDVGPVVMPLFHIAGCAPNIIMPDAEPGAIRRHLHEGGATKTLTAPAVILSVLLYPDCAKTDFSSMKLATCGASPIPVDLLHKAVRVTGSGFMQLYGPTGTTGMVLYLPEVDHSPDGNPRMASCGIPVDGAAVRVVDEDGNDAPPHPVGEILIKSPQVMKGYWNRPDATEAAIVDDWFHSGDAGYLDEDGDLYIRDRIKDMIVSGGENIFPAEVESALFEHEAMADVGVIGVADEKGARAYG